MRPQISPSSPSKLTLLAGLLFWLPALAPPMTVAAPDSPKADTWSAFPGDGYVPTDNPNLHDPTILLIAGRYFCFSTSADGFGRLRASDDLDHWEFFNPILPETPRWLQEKFGHRSVWAPDVIAMPGGKLRLYYCASQHFGSNTSAIGVAECEAFDPRNPDRGWRDLGQVIASEAGRDNFNTIDPDVIFDGEGRLWMFFGSYWSGVHVVELDPGTGKLKNPAAPALTPIARNPASPVNALEAPVVFRRGDWYFLFVSYGLAAQGVRGDYHLVMGRSQNVTGPFVDPQGKGMLEGGHAELLDTSPPMFSPGHCDVFRDRTGRELLAFHYYDGRHYWTKGKWGRPTLQVRELIWSEDGWPLPGMPVPLAGKAITGDAHPAGNWTHQANFEEPRRITFDADGTIRGGTMPGHWTQHHSKLTLDWVDQEIAGKHWLDTLYFSGDGDFYVGRNGQGMIIRGARFKDEKKEAR